MDEIDYMTKLENEINLREKLVKNEENMEVQRFKEMQSKVVVITTDDTTPTEKYFNKPEKSLKRKAEEDKKEKKSSLESNLLDFKIFPVATKKQKTESSNRTQEDKTHKKEEKEKPKAITELVADYASDSEDD